MDISPIFTSSSFSSLAFFLIIYPALKRNRDPFVQRSWIPFLPKNDFCQVGFKLVQWFLRRSLKFEKKNTERERERKRPGNKWSGEYICDFRSAELKMCYIRNLHNYIPSFDLIIKKQTCSWILEPLRQMLDVFFLLFF